MTNRVEKVRKRIQKFVDFPDKESRDKLNKLLNEFGHTFHSLKKLK